MNSRERFLTVIQGLKADRPPLFASLTPQVAQALATHQAMPYEPPLDSLLSTRISHMELLTALGNDAVGIAACAPSDSPTLTDENGIMTNEWGMKFKNAGLYNEFYSFPLAHAETRGDIESYPFPDPFAAGRFDAAKATIARYGQTHGILADLECSIFETCWYLTGLEKLLFDLMIEAEYLPSLLDTVMQINTETGKQLIALGADVIWCGDDFGSQQGLILDPDTWRKWFKPRIAQMFAEFRKVNPDIKIAWHSCGSIIPIIPDFIEIGLDILNPLQPLARDMQAENLKSLFGRELIFFGGIDVQELLPHGSPEQIQHEVRRIASVYGADGRYIAAPAHNIQPDTPVENILAMFAALVK